MIDLSIYGIAGNSERLLEQPARTLPTGGIWYWYPAPDGWTFQGFTCHGPLVADSAADEKAAVFHADRFTDVGELLADAWRLTDLRLSRDQYRGLPRGRVSRDLGASSWKLEHGGEFDAAYAICAFGLLHEQVETVFVAHEQTDPKQVNVIRDTIAYHTDGDRRTAAAFDSLQNFAARDSVSDTSTNRPSRGLLTSMRIDKQAD